MMTEWDKDKIGTFFADNISGQDHSDCIPDNLMSEFIENSLPEVEKKTVMQHLNSCDDCFEIYRLSLEMTEADQTPELTSIPIPIPEPQRQSARNLKPLAIAASIILVFLIGFFYSNLRKGMVPDKPHPTEALQAIKAKEPKRERLKKEKNIVTRSESEMPRKMDEIVSPKKYSDKGKAERPERRQKKGEKSIKSVAKFNSQEDKKHKPQAKSDAGLSDDLEASPPKEALKKESPVQTFAQSRQQSKTVETPVVIAEKSDFRRDKKQSKSAKQVQLGRAVQQQQLQIDSFAGLAQQGYYYQKKNYFKNLTPEKIKNLLNRWKKILPILKDEQKKIATETIQYLLKISSSAK